MVIYNKSKLKNKRVETNFFERCNLLNCSNNFSDNKEKKFKKEIIIAADNIISDKAEIFELWKCLDQFKLLKKILLNENQCYMLNHIGLKEILNKIDKENHVLPEQEYPELKDIEGNKEKVRRLKLIEYYKLNKVKNESNNIDDLLWYYLDDEVKQVIEEELNKI